ncbi:MAG: hypothetical protein QNJ53_30435 [Pleurocapsa sp. MO_192.B19]|nr:hypothetical protein [Pleurocapsa sp. MO_192.B19]
MFTWYSEAAKGNCHCRLRLYKISFNRSLIIVSELPDNPGRSITDEAPTLINLVCYQFGLAPFKVMWIEHYPSGYLKEVETYDEVMLAAGYIYSRRIQKQKLSALLGVSL